MGKSKFDNEPCTVVALDGDGDLHTIEFDSFKTYKNCVDGQIARIPNKGPFDVVEWNEDVDGELPRDEEGYVLSTDELEERGFDIFDNYALEYKHYVVVGAKKVLDRT